MIEFSVMMDAKGNTFGTKNSRQNIVPQKILYWEILRNNEKNKNPKNLAGGGITYITTSLLVTDTQTIGRNVDK